jgi:hypothetical protein
MSEMPKVVAHLDEYTRPHVGADHKVLSKLYLYGHRKKPAYLSQSQKLKKAGKSRAA